MVTIFSNLIMNIKIFQNFSRSYKIVIIIETNLLLINRKPVSNRCMLFEQMSMFEKLQTQSIKLKMNYDYNYLHKNPQKYVPDPKKISLLQTSRKFFCNYVINTQRTGCINFKIISKLKYMYELKGINHASILPLLYMLFDEYIVSLFKGCMT